MKATKTIEIEVCDLCGEEYQPAHPPPHMPPRKEESVLSNCAICRRDACALCVGSWVYIKDDREVICNRHPEVSAKIVNLREQAQQAMARLLAAVVNKAPGN